MGNRFPLFRLRRRLPAWLRLVATGLLFILFVAPDWPPFQSEKYRLDTYIDQNRFDFLVWELETLAKKAEVALTAGQRYLDDEQRKTLVLNYLADLRQVLLMESELNRIYADPAIEDPETEAIDLLARLEEARVDLAGRQPLVEEIVQEQVAAVLIDEGFGFMGFAWPPVQMQMTELPTVLIISPREDIRQIYSFPLQHGLNAAQREEIEAGIYSGLNRSALVDDISGLGFYPAMILETSRPEVLLRIVAHEWVHHWLTFKPLGIRVLANQELRTINETVASIVGDEVGLMVLERFYPELIEPELETTSSQPSLVDAPAFDFNGEMRITRLQVDEFLAEGQVDEAEAYMEERRKIFVEARYIIRKLNQAYFAFRGAYADEPGEQGDDPIGPAILSIRNASPSLKVFIDRMAPITSVEDLERIVQEIAPS